MENAWPVHDLIVNSALACCCNGSSSGLPSANDSEYKKDLSEEFKHGSRIKDYVTTNMVLDRPLLHDALNGPYHPRFGIHEARQLVKNIISRITHYHYQHQNQRSDDECQHNFTDFVDINECTALHVALESKWPIYDLIVQANPHCLEAHDPTRHGFFPFQTAACAFTACYPPKSDDTDKEPDEMKIRIGSEANMRHVQPSVLDILDEAGGLQSSDSTKVTVAGSEQEASLMQMSMLFELIRESPRVLHGECPTRTTNLVQGQKQMWKGWNQQWLVIPLQDDQRREEDPPLLTNETVHNWYILTLFVLTCNYHHSNDSFINMAQFRKSQPKSSSLPNPNLLQIVKLKMFSIPCVAQYISFFDAWLDFIIVCCFVTLFESPCRMVVSTIRKMPSSRWNKRERQ